MSPPTGNRVGCNVLNQPALRTPEYPLWFLTPSTAQTAGSRYVVVALALANLVPFIYLWLRSRSKAPAQTWERTDDRLILISVGAVGVADCLALALFWRSTLGACSVGLLLFVFVGGGVDCLTSLLFYPFAGRFPPAFTSCLMAGEALTGLLASLLATVQATSADPSARLRFSVSAYFCALAAIMAASAVAYLYLRRRLHSVVNLRAAPVAVPEQGSKTVSSNPLLGVLTGDESAQLGDDDESASTRALAVAWASLLCGFCGGPCLDQASPIPSRACGWRSRAAVRASRLWVLRAPAGRLFLAQVTVGGGG